MRQQNILRTRSRMFFPTQLRLRRIGENLLPSEDFAETRNECSCITPAFNHSHGEFGADFNHIGRPIGSEPGNKEPRAVTQQLTDISKTHESPQPVFRGGDFLRTDVGRLPEDEGIPEEVPPNYPPYYPLPGCCCCGESVRVKNIRMLSPGNGHELYGHIFDLEIETLAVGKGLPIQPCKINWFEKAFPDHPAVRGADNYPAGTWIYFNVARSFSTGTSVFGGPGTGAKLKAALNDCKNKKITIKDVDAPHISIGAAALQSRGGIFTRTLLIYIQLASGKRCKKGCPLRGVVLSQSLKLRFGPKGKIEVLEQSMVDGGAMASGLTTIGRANGIPAYILR